MRRFLMLEEHKTGKREFGFDYIELAAEIDTRCSNSKTCFYRNMINPRRSHTPDEFTLEMRVDAECLRLDIILSQPAPQPQCDPSSRRAAVDTGSEEPGTPPRSPAVGTGSDGPGVLRADTQMEKEELFPLETRMDVFLNFNSTGAEQECILLQPDVGVKDNKV